MEKTKGTVISLGGSTIFDAEGNLKKDYLDGIKKLVSIHNNVIIVVGGGIRCRKKIANIKNNFDKDVAGIKITKQNAKIVAKFLGFKYYSISSLNSATKIPNTKVVLGGIFPGVTTDADAALIAESKNYRFINVTNVKGVYSKDPSKFKSAKFFSKININELIKIVFNADPLTPGLHTVLDLVSLFVIRRSKIPTVVCSSDLNNLKKVLQNKNFVGTRILF